MKRRNYYLASRSNKRPRFNPVFRPAKYVPRRPRTFYYRLATKRNSTRYYLRSTRLRRARALASIQFGKRLYRR